MTLGQFIRVLACEHERFGVLYEGCIRVRCQARRHDITPGRVMFHYYSRETGELLEIREGPYRKR